MSPDDFIAKWQGVTLTEHAAELKKRALTNLSKPASDLARQHPQGA
jgi:hypothetical protein